MANFRLHSIHLLYANTRAEWIQSKKANQIFMLW